MKPFFPTALVALLPAIGIAASFASAASSPRTPNIVIIYIDDMGYADIGPFGAKGYTTPHLDRMAAEGMKFTSFYSAQPICSASRAALMTGCYANRVGISGALGPHARTGISDREMTIAQLCKQKNYATAIFGKWHLGDAPQFLPTRHGFDEYYGLPYSNDMWPQNPNGKFPPLPLMEQERVLDPNVDDAVQNQLTTRYTERAVSFIERNKDRPFFLYVPHTMVHVPLHVSDKFRGKTERGLFGDVVEEVDWSVGQILGALKKNGLDGDTLVMFCSDNGPWLCYGDNAGSAYPLREGKATSWDGGVREPTLMRWPGHMPAGKVCDAPLMTIDMFPTIAHLIGGRLPDHKIDGVDLTGVITGQTAKSPHEVLYFYYGQNNLEALRSGKWKLELPRHYPSLNGRPGGHGGKPAKYEMLAVAAPELYDLDADPGQAHNVAAEHSDVLAKMMDFAERAREELGDGLTKRAGTGRREPGRLPNQGTSKAAKIYDVVIYGGTSAGVAAAVQVKRLGKSVALIEPTGRLGGLTTGGLGETDIGNKAAIGGLAREFYERVRKHYDNPTAWKWQKAAEYAGGGQSRSGKTEAAMWTFEPSAALAIVDELVREAGVEVIYRERLDRTKGVAKYGPKIMAIGMESGRTFRGRVFLDATYEGDLMAAAGVSYTIGREANSKYAETLNGVQAQRATHHQFVRGVDPYVLKGDPKSGLLPFIDAGGPGKEGEGDRRVQAYCFRMCLTDQPANRIPFAKPAGYDELWYEPLLRNFEAGQRAIPWNNSSMPNRKTDTNNNTGFSTDFIGQSYDYPEASYAERAKIVARHLRYQQGLMWTLANNPRVPERIRKEVARWGTCRDEFVESSGWPEQIYVREARRMIGAHVMTQHNCEGREMADDAVGLAAYTMDSHNVRRYVDAQGYLRNEGDVQVRGFPPYPISYRSLLPRAWECSNLLVPVCLSASHIAYGSIRMEPVFMVLGQSAATAACQAIDDGLAVQNVNYVKLRQRLLDNKQVLEWPARGGKTAK